MTIPASVTNIGSRAFYCEPWSQTRCSRMVEVNFAEGSQLETIGSEAFRYSELASLTIPASVTHIGMRLLQVIKNAYGNW